VAEKKSSQRGDRGNVTLFTALAMLPISLLAFNAVTLADIARVKSSLQAAADAGALAGAGELGIVTRGTEGIIETAESFAHKTADLQSYQEDNIFRARVDEDGGSVTVTGSLRYQSPFGPLGGGNRVISVTATAEALRNMPLCVLQTGVQGEKTTSTGLRLSDGAVVRAPGCLVQANQSIDVRDSARIEAGRVNAGGSAQGQIVPVGNPGSMPIADPFINLDLAATSSCKGPAMKVTYTNNDVIWLPPGVHCDELIVSGGAELKLQPGEHYFQEKIKFRENARLSGEDVVLIFGDDKSFDFSDKVEVRLKARRSGPFAGFLVATSRNNQQTFNISSDRVRELLGTIYIPSAELFISTKASVAEESAWSVIIAKSLRMTDDPILVINKNYLSSNVPVPKGVGPSSGAPRLSQ
jgi:Flp pilus assembly protein TadG